VVHDTGAGVAGSATPGYAALAPRPSSIVSLMVSGLCLPGSPGSLPPPISWKRVEDEAKFIFSYVATVERLLHETLASVHRNILCLIQVSLERETKSCPHSTGFLHAFSFLLCFVSVALVLGQCRCACVAGGVDFGVGSHRHYGGCPCHDNACCRDFYPGGHCGAG
jgi:hypothetical protein